MHIGVRMLVLIAAGFAVTTIAGCPRGRPPAPGVEGHDEATDDIAAFRRAWLMPARIAPPAIEFLTRDAAVDAVHGTATPAIPEDADWNDWPGAESRLFNNRVGLMFVVDIAGDGRIEWMPDRSSLRVNRAFDVPPATSADQLLVPLLSAALEQERAMVDADLVDRTRGAGPFRAAYVPQVAADGHLHGVVVFPLPDPDQQVVDVTLTIAVRDSVGAHVLTWAWQ